MPQVMASWALSAPPELRSPETFFSPAPKSQELDAEEECGAEMCCSAPCAQALPLWHISLPY